MSCSSTHCDGSVELCSTSFEPQQKNCSGAHSQYIVIPWDVTGAAEQQLDGKHVTLECQLASSEEKVEVPSSGGILMVVSM